MILKKPYALFIKFFKPTHIFLSILTAYLIYKSNGILQFFNQYMHSNESVVGKNIREQFFSSSLYVIPIMVIVFCLIFMGIMFRKKKPITFYVINIFIYLSILIINIYCMNFLGIMEKNIISIKIVKLNHDLILINMILEVIMFVLFIIRGLGLNFKKFNFDSDITKLNVSDSDKEEIELNLSLDLETSKRKRKKNFRYLKYFYKENKFIVNCVTCFLLVITSILAIFLYTRINNKNIEGNLYTTSKFSFKVNKSIFITNDLNNKKITDNYLLVVDSTLNTTLKNVSLFSKDFRLEVGDAIFEHQTKYENSLIDIGNVYKNDVLTQDNKSYIFVFEIPQKYITSELFFVYNDEGRTIRVLLNPKNYVSANTTKTVSINQKLDFNETLGKIDFSINSFEIANNFLLKYNYCISKNDCILSKEYIKPTINENFDKAVLKISVNYLNESELNLKRFYDFFSKFGSIEYVIDGVTYLQNSGFEEIRSKKVDTKNDIYIGVNINMMRASSIKFIFNIRDSKYVYILK